MALFTQAFHVPDCRFQADAEEIEYILYSGPSVDEVEVDFAHQIVTVRFADPDGLEDLQRRLTDGGFHPVQA